MSIPDLTIAVPALNEENRIGDTLRGIMEIARQVPERRLEILAVDDGSTDRTAAIIEQLTQQHAEIRLLKNPRNLGLGASIRRALAEARGAKFLIVPGDNDLPAPTLAILLHHAHAADMVMCYFPDRQFRGPGRRLLSALFGFIYAAGFDVHVQYINGPCVYPVARLRELGLFATRFSIVAEINVKLLRQGVSFVEIPSHRQTGLAGSSSLSLRNLREVAAVFLRLCYEIHFQHPRRYRQRPVRVRLAAGPTGAPAASAAPEKE
jgi:glycosyltransferase involved in cell wall biosynthesis